MIGALLQLRSSRATSVPVPSGKHEVEHDRLGRAQCRRGQRSLGRVGGVHLVARAAEARPQCAQDLRLVVDDEDAGSGHAGTRARASATGSASTKVAPCPSCDSTQTRPPFASAKPRAIASPSPAPRAGPLSEPRWKGSKMRSASLRRDSRTVVDDAHEHLGAGLPHLHANRLVGRRVAQCVLDEVGYDPLDLVGVGVDERRVVAGARPRHGFRPRRRRAPGERGRRPASPPARAPPRRPAGATGRAGCSQADPAARPRRGSSRRARGDPPRPSESSPWASAPAEVRIAISGERRSWLTALSNAVFIASLRRRASASSASPASRSRSSVSSRRARKAASASSARRRDRPASSLTTTAVTRKTSSANQLRESCSVSV